MQLRHDAGYAAGAIVQFLRELTQSMGGNQLATCGVVDLEPNLINVIAQRARVTVALRNTDARIAAICVAHGVEALLTRDRDFSLFPELALRNPFDL